MILNDELGLIFERRNRDNMQPTIDALLPYYAAHPENARVLYEVGGAYDTAGQEDIAQGFYEKALAAGLEGDLLRRCYVQYESTLRNVGTDDRSLGPASHRIHCRATGPRIGPTHAGGASPGSMVRGIHDASESFVPSHDAP